MESLALNTVIKQCINGAYIHTQAHTQGGSTPTPPPSPLAPNFFPPNFLLFYCFACQRGGDVRWVPLLHAWKIDPPKKLERKRRVLESPPPEKNKSRVRHCIYM